MWGVMHRPKPAESHAGVDWTSTVLISEARTVLQCCPVILNSHIVIENLGKGSLPRPIAHQKDSETTM